MKRKQFSLVAYGLIGAVSIGLVAACSSVNTAGESEFNSAMNACERMDKTDEREQCVNAAIAKQQTAVAKATATRNGRNP
jgi:hypothetical protein